MFLPWAELVSGPPQDGQPRRTMAWSLECLTNGSPAASGRTAQPSPGVELDSFQAATVQVERPHWIAAWVGDA